MNPAIDLPKFSIVVPMYNRVDLISRSINSCLIQDFCDFEIVVVDDASSDDSVAVVTDFKDVRIVLLRHAVNRGVGPTRNTGINAARGAWIILLDSDDELLPGALAMIDRRTLELDENISRLAFMYQLDCGGFSPSPPLIEDTWDYSGYICWAEVIKKHSDFCNVIKKGALTHVKFPETRAYEALFHLDFAKYYLTKTFVDVVGTIHSDANNRSLNFTQDQLLEGANNNAQQIVELLDRHGASIKQAGEKLYWEYVRSLITLLFLAGDRLSALKYFYRYLQHDFFSKKLWGVMVFGMLGKRPLAWLKYRLAE